MGRKEVSPIRKLRSTSGDVKGAKKSVTWACVGRVRALSTLETWGGAGLVVGFYLDKKSTGWAAPKGPVSILSFVGHV